MTIPKREKKVQSAISLRH